VAAKTKKAYFSPVPHQVSSHVFSKNQDAMSIDCVGMTLLSRKQINTHT